MAFARPPVTPADGTFSAAGAAAWAAGFGVSGATVGGIPYCPTASTETTSSGLTYGAATGEGLVVDAGTATTNVAALSVARVNNNAAVVTGVKIAFDDQVSAAGFLPLQVLGGVGSGTSLLSLSKAGKLIVPNNVTASSLLLTKTDIDFNNDGIRFASTALVNWLGTTGLSYVSSGVLAIGSLTPGDFSGSLKLTNITAQGRVLHGGSAPTITAGGGTNPTIVGRDEACVVTIGTGGIATSVEVTFNTAFANIPICVLSSDTDIVPFKAVETQTKVTITATLAFTAGSKLSIITRGYV